MNKENYGSVEACQRLLKANILLVTDMVWATKDGCEFQLIPTEDVGKIGGLTIIPAVGLAEVWRELPDGTDLTKDTKFTYGLVCMGKMRGGDCDTKNENPTDALIDLLIWVTAQRKEKAMK
ncbi:hypothetical protein EHM76_00580, partial [bacterium]